MKKKSFALVIAIASLVAGILYFLRTRPLPDWSKEMNVALSQQQNLSKDPRYDFAYVVKPYSSLDDRDKIDFTSLRRAFGSNFNDDSSALLVFVKEGHVMGFAEIKRSIRDLSSGPDKLAPY